MKITVCGAGVSGSYIATRLIWKGYKVRIYDPLIKRGHRCAYGSHYKMLKEKLRNVFLDVDDYLLCKVKKVYLNDICIDIEDAIIIDKPRMLEEILPKDFITPRKIKNIKKLSADLIINATSDPLYPMNNEGIAVMPTLQYKTKLNTERETAWVYFNPKYLGYAWIFPLDDEGREFHVGAGSIGVPPLHLIKEMMKFYGFKLGIPKCACSREIKMMDPEEIVIYEGKVVSVGESAGAVYPLTGEGTLPSMDSCDILFDALRNVETSSESDLGKALFYYASGWWNYLRKNEYDKAYKIVKFGVKHPKLAWIKGIKLLIKRVKIRTKPVFEMKKLLKVLSYFIKSPRVKGDE